MLEAAIHDKAEAALNRLLVKHSDLNERLGKAYAYAVFPSVGRACVVIGGAYGEGEVYERGQPVGFVTMSQITVGVQVGGQTFIELIIFNKKRSLDEFKHCGKLSFTANASAVIVKAAATASSSPSGIEAKTYSRGGMLLEISLGGSNFLFVPPLVKNGRVESSQSQKESKEEKPEEQFQEQLNANTETEEKKHHFENFGKGVIDRIMHIPELGGHIGSTVQKLVHQAGKMDGKNSIFKKAGNIVSGIEKEQSTYRVLHQDIQGALKMIIENNPDFQKNIDNAYGYAVFPSVGRASLVLGGCYGKGEVFEQGHIVGYAGIVQVTLGIQVGGETITEVVIFSDKASLDRFKQSKLSFAANASAVIVKAGAGVTNSYQSGRVHTFSEGGLLIEAAIGVQKCIFKPAALTRGKSIEDESGLQKAA